MDCKDFVTNVESSKMMQKGRRYLAERREVSDGKRARGEGHVLFVT